MIDRLKAILVAVAIVFGIFLAISFSITTHEAVPDNAQFLVNVQDEYILPRPIEGLDLWRDPQNGNIDWTKNCTEIVTYRELLNQDNPYHDFDLPDIPEWNSRRLYGREVSLFWSIVNPPLNRWDSDGRWRY